MPELKPFRGIRYASLPVDGLDFTAPPYDVIGPAEHIELCRRSPHNVVRLILGERETVDALPPPAWYARSAELLTNWRSEGVLQQEAAPAFYLYTQQFTLGGVQLRRKLLLGALRLAPYGAGHVCPHEYTLPGPKADRLRLMKACPANLSPILAFFPDDGAIDGLLAASDQGPPLASFPDEYGIEHELRVLADESFQEQLTHALAPLPLYIADGHHRYETAIAYQAFARQGRTDPLGALPCDYMMVACMSSADPGLVIRATHRMIGWEGPPGPAEVIDQAREWFHVEPVDPQTPPEAIPDHAAGRGAPSFVLYGGPKGPAAVLELRDEAALAACPSPPGSPVRRLPSVALAWGVVERILHGDPSGVSYTAAAGKAVAAVDSGDARLAAFLPGIASSDVMAVVNAGERMPPKSTYFWPKPSTGIVIRSLQTNT